MARKKRFFVSAIHTGTRNRVDLIFKTKRQLKSFRKAAGKNFTKYKTRRA